MIETFLDEIDSYSVESVVRHNRVGQKVRGYVVATSGYDRDMGHAHTYPP